MRDCSCCGSKLLGVVIDLGIVPAPWRGDPSRLQRSGRQPSAVHGSPEQQPTPAYRAGDTAVSALELPMLAYYTANGDKPDCDQRPATAVDRAWLTLYVADGADPAHVRRQLG